MNTLEFLAQVAANIRADGKCISAKDAKVMGRPTTGEAAALTVLKEECVFETQDVDLASAALAWIREFEGDDKFLKDLRNKVALDDMLFSNASIAAWVIPSFTGKDNGNQDLSAYKDAVYYGKVGGEAAFSGQVVSVFTTKGGQFGPQSFVTMVDNANHVFLWKTSGDRANGLKAGQSILCWGQIKQHTEYKGVKQTRLVRPKITLR